MIDLKAFLEERKQVLNCDNIQLEDLNILPTRHRLLAKAKGAIRKHLEMQLTDALRRFEDESTPKNGRELA